MSVDDFSGRTIGRYRLGEVLGKGGMSAVYHGYQTDLERHVAVKILSAVLAQDPGYIQRFTQEARTVAMLEHPHIVPIYDYGSEGGNTYVVMRLLTGGTLSQRINHRRSTDNPLPSLGETAKLLNQLARALDYAHSRGVIHRDIKGSNVMFDGQGSAYLVDFGIAKVQHGNPALTQEGIVMGTPYYMSPEQWRDEELTPATDQYSLGVLIYLMVTGRMPFRGKTPHGLMHDHLNEMPTRPHTVREGVPEAVSQVLQWPLAKDPEERFPSLLAFAEAFENAIEGAEGKPSRFFTFPLPASQTPTVSPTVESTPDEPEGTVESTPSSAKDTLLSKRVRAQETVESRPSAKPTMPARPAVSIPGAPPVTARPPEPEEESDMVKPLLFGAGIGLALLAVIVILVIVVALSLLNRGDTDEEEQVVDQPTAFQTSVAEQPTLDTAASPLPSPALTPRAGTNPSFAGTSVITAENADRVLSLGTFQNNISPARSVAVSPDGSLLAAGKGDNTIVLWDLSSGSQIATLTGHGGVVYGLAFNNNGTLLASAGGEGRIFLWDVPTRTRINTLAGHSGEVRAVAFSPDGRLLASAGVDETARLWDVASGAQTGLLSGHTSRVLAVAFSPDSSRLASGGGDNLVIVWDVASGTRQMAFNEHTEQVRAVTFSPDGTRLASGSTDNSVRVYDITTRRTLHVLTHGRDVFSLAFTPDGSVLASGGRDNNIRLWDVSSGRQRAVLQGHSGWVFDLDFNADGSILASGSGDASARLWGLRG